MGNTKTSLNTTNLVAIAETTLSWPQKIKPLKYKCLWFANLRRQGEINFRRGADI